jgi:hypothetical protein
VARSDHEVRSRTGLRLYGDEKSILPISYAAGSILDRPAMMMAQF